MPDVPMPEEMIAWMRQRDWSAHHQQWHFERRWDFWHAMAQRTDLPDEARQEIQEMVAEAVANGWTRAAVPEGTAGGGEEFLFMHRAMFHLLTQTFPQHFHTLRGWNDLAIADGRICRRFAFVTFEGRRIHAREVTTCNAGLGRSDSGPHSARACVHLGAIGRLVQGR